MDLSEDAVSPVIVSHQKQKQQQQQQQQQQHEKQQPLFSQAKQALKEEESVQAKMNTMFMKQEQRNKKKPLDFSCDVDQQLGLMQSEMPIPSEVDIGSFMFFLFSNLSQTSFNFFLFSVIIELPNVDIELVTNVPVKPAGKIRAAHETFNFVDYHKCTPVRLSFVLLLSPFPPDHLIS